MMVIYFLALAGSIRVDEEYVILYMALVEFMIEAVCFALLIGWVTQ